MKLLNLMSGDTLWIYNITDKVYSELRVYRHSYADNLTYIKRTGREQNYLPPSAKFVPSVKLARTQYGNNDTYYTLRRNTWYDKLRDFKNSVISRILWKIKGDTGII